MEDTHSRSNRNSRTIILIEANLPSHQDFTPGLVVSSQSGFFNVQTEADLLVCQLRGKLKQGSKEGDLVAIGDRVLVSLVEEGQGLIESVEPRQRSISRSAGHLFYR